MFLCFNKADTIRASAGGEPEKARSSPEQGEMALDTKNQTARYVRRQAPPPPSAATSSAPVAAPRSSPRRLAPLPTQGSLTSLESIDYAEAWGVNGRKGDKASSSNFFLCRRVGRQRKRAVYFFGRSRGARARFRAERARQYPNGEHGGCDDRGR
jgi:hypothetical protein